MKISKLSVLIGSVLMAFFTSNMSHAAQVSAWMPSWGEGEGFQSFQHNVEVIDTISPFWYHVNGDGTLSPTTGAEDQEVIDFAKANGVTIIPTISNSFDGEKISGFLNDEEQRANHIQNIVNKVLEFDYDGIDIDYEGVWSADTEAFTAYIQDLNQALDEHGKLLTIAVMSQSYGMEPNFGTRGQDWEAIGKEVDEFRIMAYDYNWRGSEPGPVAPWYWVDEILEYAVDKVEPSKIRLGIPFYGYAWSDNGVEGGDEFYSYTYESVLGIVDTYEVDFQYEPSEKTNRLFYLSDYDDRDPADPFEIWFENRVSLEPKLQLVNDYGIGGIAIWRLGREDEENWDAIRRMLKDEYVAFPDYFSDVDGDTPYVDSIDRLAVLGLVKGQGETGLFGPDDLVNRAEILKMSLNSFAVDTSIHLFPEAIVAAEGSPSDPPLASEGGEEKQEIDGNNVETSDLPNLPSPPGQSDSEDDIVLQISGSGSGLSDENSPFFDVSFEAWYRPYVLTAVDMGIAEGYPDGYFRPGNNIIRVEALKLALESAEVDLTDYYVSDNWYDPYKYWAIDNRLYSAENFVPGDEITRAEATYIIHEVMKVLEAEPKMSRFN